MTVFARFTVYFFRVITFDSLPFWLLYIKTMNRNLIDSKSWSVTDSLLLQYTYIHVLLNKIDQYSNFVSKHLDLAVIK